MMQIFFLVLSVAMIVMLWVITKQEQTIIELNHKINMLKLEMKGNEAVNAVTPLREKVRKKQKRR